MRYRAVRAVEQHPWLTLSGVTSIAALWPIVLPVMAWLFGFIDTVPQAKERENLMKAEILKSQADIANSVAAGIRQAAGLSLQGLYNATMMTRNRVNDCNIMRQNKKQLSPLELSACYQYDQEYEEAKRRYDSAQASAMQTWRGQ